MPEKHMMRIGAAAGVIGAILLMIANILHPRADDIHITAEQIKEVAQSDFWITDHLLILVGSILIAVFLIALHRTMLDGLAGTLSRLAYFGTLASTAVVTVLMGLDGMASKTIHDAWADAPDSEKAVALRVAEAMEEVDIGVFSAWIILFFGATFIAYGLAVAMSDNFPKWLGWAAAVLGLISLVVGFYQAYDGLSTFITNYAFAGSATLLTLWVLVMAILMGRKTMQAEA